MKLEELAKKQAYSIPGYELISFFEAAFPVYRIQLIVSILTEQRLSVVQEYILKMTSCDLDYISDIMGFLGLSQEIIEDSILALTQQELIFYNFEGESRKITLSDKGKTVMESLIIMKPIESKLSIVSDGLTGSLEPHKIGLASPKRVKDLELHTIKPYIEKPKIEDIDYSQVRKLIKRIRKDSPESAPPNGELFDINEIEKAWIEYKRLRVFLFYSTKDDDVMVQVFERSQRVPEYEQVLLRMEREGIHSLPTISKLTLHDDVVDTQVLINIEAARTNKRSLEETEERYKILTKQLRETENIEDIDDIDKASIDTLRRQLEELNKQLERARQEDRVLSTYDHRPILEQALREAKNRVIIISPWIERGGLDDDLLSLISQALQRKVEVNIGYGISDERNSHRSNALKRLEDLGRKSFGKYLSLVFLGNTHEKVLICDNQFTVITSFNWLSFKGDPNRGFRKETGVFSRNPELIKTMTDDALKRLNESIECVK